MSNLGETLLTKTREGVDQSEGVRVSEFGETISTRTAEGTDQREFRASDFGETVMTATSEGVDQSEKLAPALPAGEVRAAPSKATDGDPSQP